MIPQKFEFNTSIVSRTMHSAISFYLPPEKKRIKRIRFVWSAMEDKREEKSDLYNLFTLLASQGPYTVAISTSFSSFSIIFPPRSSPHLPSFLNLPPSSPPLCSSSSNFIPSETSQRFSFRKLISQPGILDKEVRPRKKADELESGWQRGTRCQEQRGTRKSREVWYLFYFSSFPNEKSASPKIGSQMTIL